jgi:hypothetical protein
VATPIDLEQHALTRKPVTAAMDARGAPSAWTRNSRGRENPVHGDARDLEAFPLGEHLGEMLVIEAGVAALRQLHHALPELAIERIAGAPAPVAMGERLGTVDLIAAPKSAELPFRQAHQRRRL